MRPAALMRGASTKPTCTEVMALSMRPASCSRAWRPMKSDWVMHSKPRETMMRFSPDMGITSAMVPMAAKVQ